MEDVLGYLVVFVILAVVIGWILEKIVFPIAGVASVIALCIGTVYALILSITCFADAIKKYIDPYKYYVDESDKAKAGGVRNYFFGPGFFQVKSIVQESFKGLSVQNAKIDAWRKNYVQSHPHQWYLNIWLHLAYFVMVILDYGFGAIWVSILSIILYIVICIGAAFYASFFGVIWLMDRIYLLLHSISSRCPNCKRTSVVPIFMCPTCGSLHPKLTPDAYGVFRRECSCGNYVPTTVFNGRSKLKAYCPYCQTELATGGAQQFGIQLVGNKTSGKTTFLSAFWHLTLQKITNDKRVKYYIFPETGFDDLEDMYQNGISNATNDMNAQMYSLIRKEEKKTHQQITIYDVAGESFEDYGTTFQQQQFRYCEGAILIIDPTADPEEANYCISSFANEAKSQRNLKSSQRIDIPVAVVISKADLFKKEIGLPKIWSVSRKANAEGKYPAQMAFEIIRRKMCRRFLELNGFQSTLAIIEGEFSTTEFFPVSAIGHEANYGEPFEPWGVTEAVEWIFDQTGIKI